MKKLDRKACATQRTKEKLAALANEQTDYEVWAQFPQGWRMLDSFSTLQLAIIFKKGCKAFSPWTAIEIRRDA